MTTITTRAGKGSPLSNTECDNNFLNLNTAKLELGQAQSSGTANGVLYLNGSKQVASGSALTFDGTNLATTGIARASSFLASNTNGITLSDDVAGGFLSYGYNSGRTNVASHVWYNGITSEQMRLASTGLTVQQGAVFNESGADSDFRVESDASTHALFVDAGNDRVAVGSSGPTQKFQVYSGSGTATKMYVQSDLNFAGLYAGTGANNRGAAVEFVAHTNVIDSTGFKIFSESDVVSRALVFSYAADASSYGALSYTERMRIDGPTELVINEPGNDYDFRVESDTNTHAIFLDAASSEVGINVSDPLAPLHVFNGSTNAVALQLSGGSAYTAGTGPKLVFQNGLAGGEQMAGIQGSFDQAANGNYGRLSLFTRTSDALGIEEKVRIGSDGAFTTLPKANGIAIFNSGQVDADFIIRSVGSSAAFCVDAGTNQVGVLTSAPTAPLEVNSIGGLGGYTALKIKYGTTPVQSLSMGQVTAGNGGWFGTAQYRSTGLWQTEGTAASILGMGSDGTVTLYTNSGLTANTDFSPTARLTLYTTSAVVNEDGNDYDFRVESDTNTHALFVDAGNSYVGVNNSSPTVELDVSGNTRTRGWDYDNGTINTAPPFNSNLWALYTIGSPTSAATTATFNGKSVSVWRMAMSNNSQWNYNRCIDYAENTEANFPSDQTYAVFEFWWKNNGGTNTNFTGFISEGDYWGGAPTQSAIAASTGVTTADGWTLYRAQMLLNTGKYLNYGFGFDYNRAGADSYFAFPKFYIAGGQRGGMQGGLPITMSQNTGDMRLYGRFATVNQYGLGLGSLVVPSSGTGVRFPATQSPSSDANTLDDYEEGTWTPSWTGDVSNPTVTYSEQVGRYTKIGNLVTYTMRMVITASSGGSGNLNIGGLPFSAAYGAVAGTVSFSYGSASPILQQAASGVECVTYTEYAGVTNTRAQVSALPTASTFYFVAAGYYYVS